MNQVASPLSTFHLTGERAPLQSATATRTDLRPALFAGFRDLSRARHDFPVVLADAGPLAVISLADLTDQVLEDVAPRGKDGEALRRQVLALEREIRNAVAGGKPQRLSALWDAAQQLLVTAAGSERDAVQGNLASVREALPCDGLVLGYDGALPAQLVRHVWLAEQAAFSRRLGDRIDRLRQRLADILELDAIGTGKAWEASCLQGSIGTTDQPQFDFGAMSQVLRTAPAGNPLPEMRRRRIRAALEVLSAQRFAPEAANPRRLYRHEFDDCRSALDAYRKRLPAMAKLVRAMGIAELEIANRYHPQSHDHYFDHFGADSLGPEDIAEFPSYLVSLKHGAETAEQQGLLFEMLACGLPFKILLQTDDLLVAPAGSGGPLPNSVSAEHVAEMALAFDESFVMQSTGAMLYRLRESLSRSLSGNQAALISIYSGTNGRGVDPYLKAAAATESRAFPCFFRDPTAGGTGARISLQGNPQPDLDWPIHGLDYEDGKMARQSLTTAFTHADFSACDGGEKHLAVVAAKDWHESMVPLAQYLDFPVDKAAEHLPYVLLIDGDNRLKRAVVDQRLCEATRRCGQRWQRLQQRAGMDEMRIRATLEAERRAWQDEREQIVSAGAPAPADGTPAPAPLRDDRVAAEKASNIPVEAAESGLAEVERSSDEPWIDTVRCTSCNECTDLNNRLFAYDEDHRAYVADPDAGTYRELVEAAESCQVSIIHPGKPRNSGEPGLDELMKRAEPFI